jgi:hypothetical protein
MTWNEKEHKRQKKEISVLNSIRGSERHASGAVLTPEPAE